MQSFSWWKCLSLVLVWQGCKGLRALHFLLSYTLVSSQNHSVFWFFEMCPAASCHTHNLATLIWNSDINVSTTWRVRTFNQQELPVLCSKKAQSSWHLKQSCGKVQFAERPKGGAFLVAPFLKSSWFPYRGPNISTISVLFRLQYFDFIIRRSKTADLVRNLVYIILDRNSKATWAARPVRPNYVPIERVGSPG